MLVNRVVTDVSLTKWSPEKAYSQRDTLPYRDRGTSVQLTYRDKTCQLQGQRDANKCSTRVLINCFSGGFFSGSTSRGNWRREKGSGKENVGTGVNKGRAESSVTRSSDTKKEYLLLKGCLSVV